MVGALPAESGLKRAPQPRQSKRVEPSIAEPRIHTNLWRRGGDSTPRHPFGVKLLSRQPCSATPAPLRCCWPFHCTPVASDLSAAPEWGEETLPGKKMNRPPLPLRRKP